MYVPNLIPLEEAFFATDDGEESSIIKALMKAFQNNSPWPRRLYDSGDAVQLLRPFALEALGKVVEDFYAVTGLPREFYVSRSVPPHLGPSSAPIFVEIGGDKVGSDAAVVKKEVMEEGMAEKKSVEVKRGEDKGKGKCGEGEEEGKGVKGKKIDTTGGLGLHLGILPRTRMSLRKRKPPRYPVPQSQAKGKGVWVEGRPIVCGLGAVGSRESVAVERKRKGNAVEGVEERKEITVHAEVEDEVGNRYDMFVETDGGFTIFPVLEDLMTSDSEFQDEPDIPMSPCTSSEWDPNSHCFLLRRRPKDAPL